MGALLDDERTGRTTAEAVAATVVAGAVGGIALGALDFLAQRLVPYPWAELANSTAVWALAAFALGWSLGPRARRAAAGGVVLLAVAVEAYYLTATLAQHDLAANLTSPTTQVWLTFAVVAGALFGWAGAASRDRSALASVVGTAVPAAVLCAEALRRMRGDRTDQVGVAAFEVALAVLLLVLVPRANRDRALVLLTAIPLAVVGSIAYAVAQVG